jgi:large subunit ribosomal protein L18
VRKALYGSDERPRLNVYRSLNEIYAQVIDDMAGRTLISASTLDSEIKSQVAGMNKTDQARVVGEHVAERAKSAGITRVVFDRGGYKYHGRVKALADAARKAGLEF